MAIDRRIITDNSVQAAKHRSKELDIRTAKDKAAFGAGVHEINTIIRDLPDNFGVHPNDKIQAAAIRHMPDPRNRKAFAAYTAGIIQLFATLPSFNSPNTENIKQIGLFAVESNAMAKIDKYVNKIADRKVQLGSNWSQYGSDSSSQKSDSSSDRVSNASSYNQSDSGISTSSLKSVPSRSSKTSSEVNRLREVELHKQQLANTINGIEKKFGHKLPQDVKQAAVKYMPEKSKDFQTYLQGIDRLCEAIKEPTGQNFKMLGKLAKQRNALADIQKYISGRVQGQQAIAEKTPRHR